MLHILAVISKKEKKNNTECNQNVYGKNCQISIIQKYDTNLDLNYIVWLGEISLYEGSKRL